MKKYIPGIIVVEGKADENIIKSLFDVEVLKTNGFDIKKEDIEFLNKVHRVIVLTDSDKAGKTIRERINKNNNFVNIELDLSKCDKNNKHGVAEAELDHLYLSLLPYTRPNVERELLTKQDLYKLGLLGKANSNELRDKISKQFSLGIINSKTILSRLNLLEITYNEIEDYLTNGN